MMNDYMSRAHVLLEQERYDLAAQELRRQITESPDDAGAYSLLALCLTNLGKRAEALENASRAVHMAPDFPFAHYVMGHVYLGQDRIKEAEAAATRAIALDPEAPSYLALRGSIRSRQRQWKAALADADAGLAVDPDHIGCANVRAMALVKLNRRGEAGATLQSALAKDPENAGTHANRGWGLLHEGRHREAMEHFREALRLDPTQEWARLGITEALKARNPIYRVMLRYFLWMSALSGRTQWFIIIGGYAAYRLLNSVIASTPSAAPYLYPVLYAYFVFIYLSWTAKPLFNLLLRVDKFGRHALTREQTVATNWFGGSLLVAAACLIGHLITHRFSLLFAAIAFALLTVPISATSAKPRGKVRVGFAIYTAALAVFSVAAAVTCAVGGFDAALKLIEFTSYGFVAFIWISNIASSRS